jgi:hypothetical protein
MFVASSAGLGNLVFGSTGWFIFGAPFFSEVEWQDEHAEMKLSAGPFMRPFHPHDGRFPLSIFRKSVATGLIHD